MERIKKILILCAGIVLILFLTFFFWIRPILGKEIIINRVIPEDAKTISELIQIANTHISKYTKGTSFHVGNVNMSLNLNHEGQVRITYVNNRKKGIPDVYTVRFDTTMNRLIEINRLFRETGNDPGKLYIDEWKVSDKEAVGIAFESFNRKEERFDFENYTILTTAVGRPSWIIIFYHDKNMYRVRIDAYSGEVIDQGS